MLMNPRWSLEDDAQLDKCYIKRVCLKSVDVEAGVRIFHNSSNFTDDIYTPVSNLPVGSNNIIFISKIDS